MPDSTFGSDQPVTPDGLEFDPFEMDWPWPGAKSEIDDAPAPEPTLSALPITPPLS